MYYLLIEYKYSFYLNYLPKDVSLNPRVPYFDQDGSVKHLYLFKCSDHIILRLASVVSLALEGRWLLLKFLYERPEHRMALSANEVMFSWSFSICKAFLVQCQALKYPSYFYSVLSVFSNYTSPIFYTEFFLSLLAGGRTMQQSIVYSELKTAPASSFPLFPPLSWIPKFLVPWIVSITVICYLGKDQILKVEYLTSIFQCIFLVICIIMRYEIIQFMKLCHLGLNLVSFKLVEF